MTSLAPPMVIVLRPLGWRARLRSWINGGLWRGTSIAPSEARVISYSVAGTYQWDAPSGLRALLVELVGAGGGAGGIAATGASTGASSGGGAAGGYVRKLFVGDLPSRAIITIGTGGPGGTAGNNTGTAGTASSFAADGFTTLTGNGGGASGGSAAVSSGRVGGGLGGTASGGDLNIRGADGGEGNIVGNRGLTTGNAGYSVLGGARRANSGADGQNGAAGAGGSGAAETNSSARAGGTGGDGLCLVTEYY